MYSSFSCIVVYISVVTLAGITSSGILIGTEDFNTGVFYESKMKLHSSPSCDIICDFHWLHYYWKALKRSILFCILTWFPFSWWFRFFLWVLGLPLLTLSSCRLTTTTGFLPHWMTDCITWTEKKMIKFWSELYELRWPALFASSTAQHLSPLFFDQSGTERFLKLHRYILLHRFPGRFVRYFSASNNLAWLIHNPAKTCIKNVIRLGFLQNSIQKLQNSRA